jgi:hypothetical protein
MTASPPEEIQRSVRVYRRLMRLYPASHRLQYEQHMVQLFRDLCREAYESEGRAGIRRVWAQNIPDLIKSAGYEYWMELRRWRMDGFSEEKAASRQAIAITGGVTLIVIGAVVKILIVETGGSVYAGTAVLLVMNLLAAVLVEILTPMGGAVIGSTVIVILSVLLPLLWVEDGAAWLRENPINVGFLIILASFVVRKKASTWVLYVIALILAAAQIGISFL